MDGEKLGFSRLELNIKRDLNSNNFRTLSILEDKEIVYLINAQKLSNQEEKIIRDVCDEIHSGNNIQRPEHALIKYLIKNKLQVTHSQAKYLSDLVEKECFKQSILTLLLQDQDLEEIAINGVGWKNPIMVYNINYGWLKTNYYFNGLEFVKDLVNRMAKKQEKRLTSSQPYLNTMLEDGCRLHALTHPLTFNSISVTIRKFKNEKLTAKKLVGLKTISCKAMALLSMVLQLECNILIVGNTGSGKTTLLNSLLDLLPKNERIIIIEETPELKIDGAIKLSTNDLIDIGMNDLIISTLRMRPDRVIVGEIRQEKELKAFIDTILAGQGKGSLASFHAESAQEAITRMKRLSMTEDDLMALDLIIVQKRFTKINGKQTKELRRVIEISEIVREKDKTTIRKLFDFDFEKDSLIEKEKSIRIIEKIKKSFSINSIDKELKNRMRLFS